VARGLPPSLIKGIPTPSDASSVFASEIGHPDGGATPREAGGSSGDLRPLCCETGHGVAIQKLLDDEQEILARIRHLEREYQERAARRNERLRKLEEELRKHGLGVPTNVGPSGARPPRKSLTVVRDAVTVSYSPVDTDTPQVLAKRQPSGFEVDAWETHSPPAGEPWGKADHAVALLPGSPQPVAGTKSSWAPCGLPFANGNGTVVDAVVARISRPSSGGTAEVHQLVQNALQRLDGSLAREVVEGILRPKSPIRPKSPVRAKSPVPRSPGQSATPAR